MPSGPDMTDSSSTHTQTHTHIHTNIHSYFRPLTSIPLLPTAPSRRPALALFRPWRNTAVGPPIALVVQHPSNWQETVGRGFAPLLAGHYTPDTEYCCRHRCIVTTIVWPIQLVCQTDAGAPSVWSFEGQRKLQRPCFHQRCSVYRHSHIAAMAATRAIFSTRLFVPGRILCARALGGFYVAHGLYCGTCRYRTTTVTIRSWK